MLLLGRPRLDKEFRMGFFKSWFKSGREAAEAGAAAVPSGIWTGFASAFHADCRACPEPQDVSELKQFQSIAPGLCDFMSAYAGCSFNRGLYRVHACDRIETWNRTVLAAFPAFQGRGFVFSYDWLGRHFALDLQRHVSGSCQLLMFEPGMDQVLEIPATFAEFHNEELVKNPEGALAADFYTTTWLPSGGAVPDLTQCIAYKKPPFLGGADDSTNLELSDMDVYWSLCGQLLTQVRKLPDGTRVNDVRIQ
jgi:hypothetical protein